MLKDIGGILKLLCERKGAEIIEANAWPDHIPHKLSVAQFMAYLNVKSSFMIFDRYANMAIDIFYVNYIILIQ